jgi:hypothetical protein
MDIKISNGKKIKSDLILDLPTDKNQPTHTELKVVESLFGKINNKENYEEKNKSNNIYIEILKYAILIFIFMIIYNVPEEKLPTLPFIGNYEFAPILMKGIILAGAFYLIEIKILSNF